jgi:hypothetical protein
VVIGIRHGEAAVSAVLELEREERRRKLDVTEDDYMNALRNLGDLLAGKSTGSMLLVEAVTVVSI